MSAILALETGKIFYGQVLGHKELTCGELVFNTAMSGYQEVLSDPSYAGQIIVFTYPHIGNTGINFEDNESKIVGIRGVIIREHPQLYSNYRAKISLEQHLLDNKITGITGIDTRELTKIIRENGSVKASIICLDNITDKNPEKIAVNTAIEFAGTENINLAKVVSTKTKYTLISDNLGNSDSHIVVIDLGVKRSILSNLLKYTKKITVLPYDTTYNDIKELNPSLVVLSNGPADPRACIEIIDIAKKLIKNKTPTLGICLGYQILGLAMGAKIFKMKFGHHGINHPIQDLSTKKIVITSQNHNYAISDKELPPGIIVTHKSLFDNTIQGICHVSLPIYGYQGHPEAGPGPFDFNNVFEKVKLCQEEMI